MLTCIGNILENVPEHLKTKLYKCVIFVICARLVGSYCFVSFRAELNRQKQRSHELEMQLETAHNSIAEVRHTNHFKVST